VEVLALPYLRNGRLVDVRYLELSADGQRCVSSWLAKGGSHLFMKEQDLQVGRQAGAKQQQQQQQRSVSAEWHQVVNKRSPSDDDYQLQQQSNEEHKLCDPDQISQTSWPCVG